MLLKRLSKAPDHLAKNFFLHVENAPETANLSVDIDEGKVALFYIGAPTTVLDLLLNRRLSDQSAVKRVAVVPHANLPMIHDHNAPKDYNKLNMFTVFDRR